MNEWDKNTKKKIRSERKRERLLPTVWGKDFWGPITSQSPVHRLAHDTWNTLHQGYKMNYGKQYIFSISHD